ncbi:MAG: P-type conjugative transfer protein TrbL [Pseudomonadota bacterium]
MEDLGIIDQFVETFSLYIDSGFGLLAPDVAFLTSALIVIDLTLAGLFWAMGPDTDVIAKFLKKVLYVGFFALVLGNFAFLADVIFRSFAQLGLNATDATITADDILKPGFVAATGFEAAHPLLDEISSLTGPIAFFANIVIIGVLGLAWAITLFSFFFLAIQLFVTIIEFKLTTLAGFVLVPFALWNKTSFLAERVFGNIISSGIKLMVLAIIIGVGSTVFDQITAAFTPGEVTLEQAAAVILGSLALLWLGIFGPAIANGIISGAPQLGAGSAIGTAAGVGAGVAGSALAAKAGAGLAGRATTSSVKAAASVGGATSTAYSLGSTAAGGSGFKSVAGGVAGVAAAGAGQVKSVIGNAAGRVKSTLAERVQSGSRAAFTATGGKGISSTGTGSSGPGSEPQWARQIRSSQTRRDAAMTAAAAARAGDSPGSGGASPVLRNEEDR